MRDSRCTLTDAAARTLTDVAPRSLTDVALRLAVSRAVAYRLIAMLQTNPPSRSQYGGTSVQPPPRSIRVGARAATSRVTVRLNSNDHVRAANVPFTQRIFCE